MMKHLLNDQNGAIAIVAAILMTTFLGVIALGVDSGYMVATKNELQNAADAGALAGAGKMAEIKDSNIIKQTVIAAVEKNSAGNSEINFDENNITIGKWDLEQREFTNSSIEDANAVKVEIMNHKVNLFFSAQNASLGAASVAIAPDGGDGDLIPIAVDTEFDESDIGEIFTIWGDDLTPGNWGTVNLNKDDNGAAGADTIRDWMQNGYTGALDIGDNISRQTGQGAIQSNPDIVEDRINDPDRSIVVVPIVDEFHQGSGGGNNNTDKLSKITGFAIIELFEIKYKNNNNKVEKVTAKYLGPANPSGGGGGGSSSGSKGIVLVR